MKSTGRKLWMVILSAFFLLPASRPLNAADDSRYARVTIKGSLTDPETGRPMVGAVVRFLLNSEEGTKFVGITDKDGKFFVPGMTFGDYVVDITTADGEIIRGVNELPVTPEAPVELLLKISRRVRSTTSVESKPERFVAVVQKEQGINWHRFWKEFAVFFGAAAGAGAGL